MAEKCVLSPDNVSVMCFLRVYFIQIKQKFNIMKVEVVSWAHYLFHVMCKAFTFQICFDFL